MDSPASARLATIAATPQATDAVRPRPSSNAESVADPVRTPRPITTITPSPSRTPVDCMGGTVAGRAPRPHDPFVLPRETYRTARVQVSRR